MASNPQRKKSDKGVSGSRSEVGRDCPVILEHILHAIPQGVFWKDRDGAYLGCNEAFARTMGLEDPEQIVGKTDYDLLWAERAEAYKDDDQEVMKSNRPKRHIVELLKHVDGRPIWTDTTKVPLHDEKARVVGVLGIFEDITKQKRIEDALARQRDLVSRITDTSPVGIARVDREGRITFANRHATKVLGLKRDEISNRSYADPKWKITDYEGHPIPDELLPFAVVKATGCPVEDVRHAIEHQDGRRVLLSINAAPLVDEKGEFDGIVATVQDETERRKAEQTLRNENAFREAIIDRAAEGLCVCHEIEDEPHVRFTVWNNRMVEITGYTIEEINELGWYQTVYRDPEVQERARMRMNRMRQGEDLLAEEWAITGKDGTRRTVAISTSVIEASGGQHHVLALMYDLTERKKAEETVRANETRLRSIFRASPTGIGLVSNRVLLQVNERICEMTGYAEEELVGQNARILYPTQEDFEYVGREKYEQIHKSGIGTVETRWRRKDGHIIDVLMSSVPLNPKDLAAGVTFTALDITERKRAMEDLARAQGLLTEAIENSPAGILIADAPDGRIRVANAAALAIQGGQTEELTGIPIVDHSTHWQFYYPDGRPYESDDLPLSRAVLKGQISRNVELIVRRADGEERTVLSNAAPIYSATGKLLAGIAVFPDITEIKKAEEEHRRLQAQMQHVQKLESLGVLAGGIAHDFNNLLMAILGNADLAMRVLSPVSPAQGYLRDIETASRRAADLCRQMLAYSGKGRFVIETLDANEVVKEMTRMLEVSISKKAVLKYNLAANLPAVEADATQLRQVLMNLITNASEAIGDRSGIISIATGVMQCDHTYLSDAVVSGELTEGMYVYVEVADTGCGMPADVKARIFDPFFSTKFTGRGLGMAAVLGIMRGHKGTIKVYSETGKGTTIKVLFPASLKETTAMRNTDETDGDWRGSGTVLVVDDEETVRVVTERMLELMGLKAIVSVDGRDALDVFRKRHAEIDCVLLDLTMPHMDGEETYCEMRRIKKDVRVIMSSGYNEQEVTQRFVGKGLAGFIQKPFQFESLRAKLQAVLKAE